MKRIVTSECCADITACQTQILLTSQQQQHSGVAQKNVLRCYSSDPYHVIIECPALSDPLGC
jgi:hypothetical protein